MNPPSLCELAAAQCLRYATGITDIGDMSYGIARPWLSKLGREQLAEIEQKSPHIRDLSDELWSEFIARDFKDRKMPKSRFRHTYYAYQHDKEQQLGQARERLIMKQAQYNESKRATSVVTLEEPPTRPSSSPPFRSTTMRAVAKKTAAGIGFRKPQRLVPAATLKKSLSAAEPKHISGQSPPQSHGSRSQSPQSYGSLSYGSQPHTYAPALASPPAQLGSPPMSPPSTRMPSAKRRRVASVFMPRR